MAEEEKIEYLCQRCQQALRLDPSLTNIDDHTLAELSLPISPAPDLRILTQAGSLDRLVPPARLTDSGGNGFTLVGESGEEASISHRLHVTSQLFDMLSDNSQVDHPLCEECTDTLLENMEQQLELAEQDSQEYQEYLTLLNNETEESSCVLTLEQELEMLLAEEDNIMTEIKVLRTDEKKVDEDLSEQGKKREDLEKEEERYWREYSRHKEELLQAEDEYRSIDSQLRSTQTHLEKLKKTNVFNATFHIWHSGHFGTINGFRLGRLPSVPVDWNEVNTAWGQTVLLLSSLCGKIDLVLTKYKLVPYGNFSYVKVLSENKDLPLYGSGGFKLIWDTKFDAGMAAFLDCLQQFKEEVERGDSGFCLPYEMDKGKIKDPATGNSFSVKIQFNSEEQWTKAMKYMLTNLKWGLAWVTSKYTKSAN
jgi:beclin 1